MHNHFESDKDTANGNLADMILSFASIGRTKVPVTDHGVMTAFEDARDMLEHLKDKPYECSETYNTYPDKDKLKQQLKIVKQQFPQSCESIHFFSFFSPF